MRLETDRAVLEPSFNSWTGKLDVECDRNYQKVVGRFCRYLTPQRVCASMNCNVTGWRRAGVKKMFAFIILFLGSYYVSVLKRTSQAFIAHVKTDAKWSEWKVKQVTNFAFLHIVHTLRRLEEHRCLQNVTLRQ